MDHVGAGIAQLVSDTMVRVASAPESAALDQSAIAAGTPSRALMRVAGVNAATVIAQRCGDRLRQGVTVYTGPGNNGGDGWVVARSLAAAGIAVHVCEVIPAKTADAIAERDAALPIVHLGDHKASGVIIDALLGTGAEGALRGAIADAAQRINVQRARGAYVVALDVPTGLSATTGSHENSILADLTITFGTCKRGHLIARDVCGSIVVVDIGLDVANTTGRTANSVATGNGATPKGGSANDIHLPILVDASWVGSHLPRIPFDAHKGVRKKLVIVAGGEGMGGAALLAAEAALKSGIGMVKVLTHAANVSALEARLPEALSATFPLDDAALHDVVQWGDVLLAGPGLGHSQETRAFAERILRTWRGPVVLDADALNVFPNEIATLANLLGERPAVITPHVVEFGRLINCDTKQVLAERFDIALNVAPRLHATVLLKGAPTVVTSSNGDRFISAAGTAALGTGGSGDVLGGMVATLLAQQGDSAIAAACAAWVHGRAAELCRGVRGVTLQDILGYLADAWTPPGSERQWPHSEMWHARSRRVKAALPSYPVLSELPRLV